MLSLLKGFVVFVAATLGTTAMIGHAPRANHHSTAVPSHFGFSFQTPAELGAEQAQLHVRAQPYVAPPAEPAAAPAPEADSGEAAAPVASGSAAAAPRYTAPAPVPQIVIGSVQQALINSDRAAAGLPPLSWSGCLAAVAAGQDSAMVAAGRIFHGAGVSQDFGCGLGSAQTGENVGYWSGGVNDSQLNSMFMNSPEHRANIMGPYRYVGTAWKVAANGNAYIAVEFG